MLFLFHFSQRFSATHPPRGIGAWYAVIILLYLSGTVYFSRCSPSYRDVRYEPLGGDIQVISNKTVIIKAQAQAYPDLKGLVEARYSAEFLAAEQAKKVFIEKIIQPDKDGGGPPDEEYWAEVLYNARVERVMYEENFTCVVWIRFEDDKIIPYLNKWKK